MNSMAKLDLIKVPKVDRVQLLDRFSAKQSASGSLFLTTTHLIFVGDDGKETWVLHSLIANVEKGSLSALGSPLNVRCKHFLMLNFMIPREKDCHDVYLSLQQLSQPINIEHVYAFSYVCSIRELRKRDGWELVDVEADYCRMGLPNSSWCRSDFNRNYLNCETYPEVVYVPAEATKQILIASSRFRSKNRFPALSYLYSANQASICRCSQPLAGFSARCVEDEQLFDLILNTSRTGQRRLFVIDTRPRVNAMANKAVGKGFENASFYANMDFRFFSIENIHVMRSSLIKLLDVCSQSASNPYSFFSGLESCGWLRHIRVILEAGAFIAQALQDGNSCIVHCSDGWDRTPQTVSVACLLLDPFYRTTIGYLTLLEKEWLAFGHKFSDRCGHAASSISKLSSSEPLSPGFAPSSANSAENLSKEQSPTFTQFLDCTWQLASQFPRAFEFNERFLLTVHDHVHSCQFGTFLGNCDKDRKDLRLSERTYSLWGFMSVHMDEYSNPLYDAQANPAVLKPNLRPQLIRLWSGMYNRFDHGIHLREPLSLRMEAARQHSSCLDEHRLWLCKRVAELRELLGKAGVGVGGLKSPTADHSAMVDSGHFEAKSPDAPRCDSHFMGAKQHSDSESGVEADCSTNSSLSLSSSVAAAARQPHPRPTLKDLQRLSLSSFECGLVELLGAERIAVRWQPLNGTKRCSAEQCAAELNKERLKRHCWCCGNVFCLACVSQRCSIAELAGSQASVCKLCFDRLNANNILTASLLSSATMTS